jgi:hypothetical protein
MASAGKNPSGTGRFVRNSAIVLATLIVRVDMVVDEMVSGFCEKEQLI